MLLPFGLLGNSSRRESRRVLDSLQLLCLCLFIGLKAVMTTGSVKFSATVPETGGDCRTRNYSPAKPSPWNVNNIRLPI